MGLHCTARHATLIAEKIQRKRARTRVLNEWPMAARGTELNGIANAVATGRSVFLVGEPGVGKSRLLRAALDGAVGQAFVAQVAAAHENTASIFSSIHEWIRLHAAAECDPHVGHPVMGLKGETKGRKMILGIDDAHLLHPDVAASLYQLAAFDRVVMIITARSNEPNHEGISKLWLDRLAEWIEIKPFTQSAVGEVLSAKLGSYVEVETVERLWNMTGGNALLLTELVDHAITEGSLRPVGGIWRWSGFLPYVKGRLVDVVRSRLGDLRPDEAELIHMTALAESLEIDLPEVSERAHAAESLNRRGIMVTERCGVRLNMRLTYPLYRHVVAATMPKLTAYRLRLRLADAIEQAEKNSFDNRLRADALRVEAGQSLPPERLLAAASLAERRTDFALVEKLARLASVHGHSQEYAVESAMLLGKALATQWQCVDAENAFAAASRGTMSPVATVQVAQARALNLVRGLHHTDKALTVIDDALKVLPEADARPLHAYKAKFGILADRFREVAAAGDALLHKEQPQSELMQEMAPIVAFAHNALGDSRKALALLDRCQVALPDWKDQCWQFHQLVMAQTALMKGRCAEVYTVLGGLHQRMVEDNHSAEYMWFIIVNAQFNRHRGRYSDAAEQFRRASRLSIEADWLASRVWILAQLAGTLAEAGMLTEASRILSEVRVLQNRVSPCPMDVDGADLERAVVLAQVGQRDRAAVLAHKVAERCTTAGRFAQAISALHLAARIGHGRFVVDRSAQLASSVNSAVLHARADHVLALANYDAEALAGIGDRFAQLGMRPLAAEAAAQSCAAYRKAGKHHSTRMAAAKCHRLLTSYNVRLPAWVGFSTTSAHDLSIGLTAREREIAGYAATGLSNREIADRLTVSIRTVENHLQRAYSKLGISTRSDLILKLDARVSSSPSNYEQEGMTMT